MSQELTDAEKLRNVSCGLRAIGDLESACFVDDIAARLERPAVTFDCVGVRISDDLIVLPDIELRDDEVRKVAGNSSGKQVQVTVTINPAGPGGRE
jgi:hypothetical protein